MDWVSAPNIEDAPLPQGGGGALVAWLDKALARIESFLEAERGQLPLWAVAAFGAGSALWFALPDPRQWAGLLCIAGGAGLFGFTSLGGRSGRALGWFALALAAGCALVGWRAERAATPRIDRPKVVQFTARVEKVEVLTARELLRLTEAPADPDLPPQ
jgi:competence protein ComEC